MGGLTDEEWTVIVAGAVTALAGLFIILRVIW